MRGLTLFSLVRIAVKHIVILILTGILFAAGTFAYCEFIALPIYSASGTLLVTNGAIIQESDSGNTNLQNTDIVASMNFSDTVIDILEDRTIYEQLSNSINNRYSYQTLLSKAKISGATDNSLFITVSFNANTTEEAIELVNKYLSLTPEHIKKYAPGVAVTYTEAVTATQSYPRTLVFSAFAGIIGVIAAFAVILLIYSTNTIIRGEEDFRERFDVPIIGSIPDFARARSDKYYKSPYYGGYYGKGGDSNGK